MKSRHQSVLIVLGVNLIFHLILCLLFLIDPNQLAANNGYNKDLAVPVQKEIKEFASVSAGDLVKQGWGCKPDDAEAPVIQSAS